MRLGRARHHICKLQSVLGFERDSFHLPVPLRALGVVRDFPGFGTWQAVFGSNDDFERAAAKCSRASMKLLTSHFRFGSGADISQRPVDVRYFPESGHC